MVTNKKPKCYLDFFSLLFLNNINPFIHMLLPSMLENGIEAEEMSFSPLFSYVMGKEEKQKNGSWKHNGDNSERERTILTCWWNADSQPFLPVSSPVGPLTNLAHTQVFFSYGAYTDTITPDIKNKSFFFLTVIIITTKAVKRETKKVIRIFLKKEKYGPTADNIQR